MYPAVMRGGRHKEEEKEEKEKGEGVGRYSGVAVVVGSFGIVI